MKRRRFSDTEIGALTKRRKGEALSPAQRTALHRLGSLPTPKDVVRLAVLEASAIEWKTRFARVEIDGKAYLERVRVHVHEDAVRAHLRAMGPDRGAPLLKDLKVRRVPLPRLSREEFSAMKARIARYRQRRGIAAARRQPGEATVARAD